MKKIKISYWIVTGILSVMIGIGAVFNAISAPEGIKVFADLGYPAYLVPFLGVAKLLGIIAILIPGYPRIKEWAYAGLVYDIGGALYSHLVHGDDAAHWAGLIVILLLIFASYILYHKKNQAAAEPVLD